MPDTYYDFSLPAPPVDTLAAYDAKGILCYITPNPSGSFNNTPSPEYIQDVLGRGMAVCPIFEQGGEQANGGYDIGRRDGDRANGWMDRFGAPDGVRLWVAVADVPSSDGHLDAIGQYCVGFAETLQPRFQCGAYGNHAALRAAEYAAPRFDKLWAVETWGAPPGSLEDHWQWWIQEPNVVLTQLANYHSIANTDDNWLTPGRVLDGWTYGPPPTVYGIRYPFDGDYPVNSPWGPRGTGFHSGIDFGLPMHTPVVACAPGEVFYAAYEPDGGNHLAQYLDFPPAPNVVKAGYMHLESFVAQPGQHVEAGELIAYSNNTGGSTGPHLHFWVGGNANVGAVDPTPFLEAGLHRPPAPPLELAGTVNEIAMKGEGMCTVMYGSNEVSFHVTENGELVHNSVGAYGQINVKDEVLLDGCDPNVPPAARAGGNNLIVICADAGGGMRRIAWLGTGGWIDTYDNNKPLEGIHPL